uniref:Uncharacterized protein n=1 Tax=Oryza nivara TaxID=4536 RepID=A0A0E0J729_ORYNI
MSSSSAVLVFRVRVVRIDCRHLPRLPSSSSSTATVACRVAQHGRRSLSHRLARSPPSSCSSSALSARPPFGLTTAVVTHFRRTVAIHVKKKEKTGKVTRKGIGGRKRKVGEDGGFH